MAKPTKKQADKVLKVINTLWKLYRDHGDPDDDEWQLITDECSRLNEETGRDPFIDQLIRKGFLDGIERSQS